jgi:phosphinothricin acetyltransferase
MMAGPVEGASFLMTTDASAKIRRAQLADAQAIVDIYNEAILSTTATFDIEPKSVAERRQWL